MLTSGTSSKTGRFLEAVCISSQNSKVVSAEFSLRLCEVKINGMGHFLVQYSGFAVWWGDASLQLSLGRLRLSETILSSLAALERADRQSQTSWPLGILS